MAIDTTLLTLFRELANAHDPELDTGATSSFYVNVLLPFLERIGPSALESTDLEELCARRLSIYDPSIDTTEFAAHRDMLIRPLAAMMGPILREVRAVELRSSLVNAGSLTRAEVNRILANHFTELSEGGQATGTVRIYYRRPVTVTVTDRTRFSTTSGISFKPVATTTITASQMMLQVDPATRQYYMEVSIVAVERGTTGNVEAGAIRNASGIFGYLRVSNPDRLTDGGPDPESSVDGIARAEREQTLRTLATIAGIQYLMGKEWSALSPILIVGNGDAEMRRDVVTGPVQVGGLPQPFTGDVQFDIPPVSEIHVGGHTDLYVRDPAPVDQTLQIRNIADAGLPILRGTRGETPITGTGTRVFIDPYANFDRNGVAPGDALRISGVTGYALPDLLLIESVTNPGELRVASDIEEGLSGAVWEIVRFDTANQTMHIPLQELVAEIDGVPAHNDNGDWLAPRAGSVDREPWEASEGVYATANENIAGENLRLPLAWIEAVEHVDPISLEPTDTFIPNAQILLAENLEAFTGGASDARATGTIRIYTLDATWIALPVAARFVSATGRRFQVNLQVTGQVQVTGEAMVVAGNMASELSVRGRRLQYRGTWYTISGNASYNSGTNRTTLQVRETLPENGSPEGFTLAWGCRASDMTQLEDGTKLWYVDVPVRSLSNGVANNLAAGAVFSIQNAVLIDGWRVHALHPTLTHSNRERSVLVMSRWIGETDMQEIETARAILVHYRQYASLPEVADWAEDDTRKVVGEDLLVRGFRPVRVRGTITIGADEDTDAARAELVEAIEGLAPASTIHLSELLRALSVRRIQYPATLALLRGDGAHGFTFTRLTDKEILTRTELCAVEADPANLTVVAEEA